MNVLWPYEYPEHGDYDRRTWQERIRSQPRARRIRHDKEDGMAEHD